MRYSLILALGAMAIAVSSCRAVRNETVVQETFIHKYGVPVSKEDWTRNGKEGQIVQLSTDGVTLTKSYGKGILNGKTTYTFPHSSTTHIVEVYQEGELISKTENYASGVAKEEEKYSSKQLVEKTGWYEDGTPAFLERYDNGFIVNGEYRSPLNEIESKVVDGNGTRITRGFEGELIFKDKIEGGQMIERVAYFQSGEPSSVTSYKDNLIHGTRLTYMQGGLPNTVEEWIAGQRQGLTTVYFNGEKIASIPYVRGKKEGVEERYRDGKILVEEVCWKNDKQHGPRKIIIDGNTSKTEWYHEGELVSRTTFERMNHR